MEPFFKQRRERILPPELLENKFLSFKLLGNCWLKPSFPTWPGMIITMCMSCPTTGSPDKDYGAAPENEPGEFRRVQKRGEMTTFPESFVLESVLAERCMYHQEGPWVSLWAKWLARDNPWTNPINHKTWGWVTWQNSSWFPDPAAFHLDSLPSTVLFFVSKCISSDNSFPNVRQEPTLRPWKRSPFLQQNQFHHLLNYIFPTSSLNMHLQNAVPNLIFLWAKCYILIQAWSCFISFFISCPE